MNNYRKDKTVSPYIYDKIIYGFGFIGGLGILLLGSVFFIIPMIVMLSGKVNADELMDAVNMYSVYPACIAEVIGVGLAICFFKKVFIEDFKKFLKDWYKILIVVLALVVIIYYSGFFFEWLYEVCGLESESINQETIYAILNGKSKLIMVLQVAIIAPVFEEIVFRKFTFGFLRQTNIKSIISFCIVTFIFAIIHCSSEDFMSIDAYVYLFNYVFLSAILTLTYVLFKDNIYASILVHILNNVLSLLMFYGVFNVI